MSDPAKDRKQRKTLESRRPNIGMKIKFYEKSDENEASTASETSRQRPRNLYSSATLPNRRRTSKPTVVDVTSKLAVPPATSDRRLRSKEYNSDHVRLDENDNVESSLSRRRKSEEFKFRKERTTRLNSLEEISPSSASSTSKDGQLVSSPRTEDQAISFLSTEQIGRVYQSERRRSRNKVESLSLDVKEYHWKVVESKKNLEEMKKSLSKENEWDAKYREFDTEIPKDDPIAILTSPIHERVSKKDSNNSISSNVSTSSALSNKLLTLSEVNEEDKPAGRRSLKRRSKYLSWKNSSLEGRELARTSDGFSRSRPRRLPISVLQYSEDDIKPVSRKKGSSTSDNDTLSPTDKHEEKSATTQNSQTSDTTHEPSARQQNSLYPDDDAIKTSSESKSKKSSGKPSAETQYVFKVDLDEQFDISNSREDRRLKRAAKSSDETVDRTYREKEATTIIGDKANREPTEMGGALSHTQKEDDKTSHTTRSKRLQVRPWNLFGHLSNNGTQTTSSGAYGRLKEGGTADPDKGMSPQKTFKTVAVQTDNITEKREFSAQVSPTVATVETQTADNSSEGTTISLDSLIRMGAIKRTKSLALGLQSPERPRIRSASTDFGTNLRIQASQLTDNKPTAISTEGTQTSGKIASYNWSENQKFVKIFVSYSGIHLIQSKNIQVKTNGINLLLTVEECVRHTPDGEELRNMTSTLYLNRLRRPVSCLSYNVQRDMITIMLRKQKQTPWNALLFGGGNE